jgi:hypothetical protein
MLYELRSDMLGLLQKYSPVCGMALDKRTATKRWDKYLCSENHTDHYAQMKIERETDRGHDSMGGGCY